MGQTGHKTIYKVYFKPKVTYKAETRSITMIDESKIQAMGMKFLRSTEGRTRRDRIGNEMKIVRRHDCSNLAM
jgi:hypothetical protein